MKRERHMEPKLGEQLTGLSPTVCRRAIAAIRQEDERLGGENRTEFLPLFCRSLAHILDQSIAGDFELNPSNRQILLQTLDQAERFLNIVEGIKPAEAQKPAGDRIPPGTFDDHREVMEEASGRG